MVSHVQVRGVVPRIQYTADGVSQTYEFPFAVFSADNVKVYLGDSLQNSSTYTVSSVRSSSGGSVTFTTAPTQGTIVTIMRNLSIERTTDFQEGGALRADTLNDEFDYQIACQQQIADNLNRSMVLPPYAIDSNVDLTLPTPTAGKALVWNSAGTNLENSTVEINALENTLKGYKTSAESAASTATAKAGIASDKADIATEKAQIATDKAAEATSTLASKADKDMDNLSTTGKNNVIQLGLPDYTAGVSKSFGTQYTADSDGFLKAFVFSNVDNSYTLNGTNYCFQCGNGGGVYAGASFFIPINKDDTYSVTANSATGNSNYCIFYPLKGVQNA